MGSQFQRTRVHEGGEGVVAGAAAESLHLELRKGSKKSELGMESLLNSQSPPLVTYFLQKGTFYSYPNITNWGPSSHMPETMGTSHQTSSGKDEIRCSFFAAVSRVGRVGSRLEEGG